MGRMNEKDEWKNRKDKGYLKQLQRCRYISNPQTTQTAYLLSQGVLRRPKLTRHDMLRFNDRF